MTIATEGKRLKVLANQSFKENTKTFTMYKRDTVEVLLKGKSNKRVTV